MKNRTLARFSLIVATLTALAGLGCATSPQRHEVALGGPTQSAQSGRMMAGRASGDVVSAGEHATTGFTGHNRMDDGVRQLPAWALVQHLRPTANGRVKILGSDFVHNTKTTAGIDFLFAQAYAASGAQAVGLAYIGLSNDALTETTASTTLSNEIAVNGLSRHIATYAHTGGAATATLAYTFTCATGAQSAQKAALFSAATNGTMTHVLAFTQRALQVGDQLAITFTITLTMNEANGIDVIKFAWNYAPAVIRDDEEYLMAA